MWDLLGDTPSLIKRITAMLHDCTQDEHIFPRGISGSMTTSAVLLPLKEYCGGEGCVLEPCMVFNKRSQKVRQPGDLCFPGGRTSLRLDPYIAKLLPLPFLPLARWPHWSTWREQRPGQARRLALLLATSLRESLEEMRLNPLGVKFLGPLPSQSLTMFRRVIYPLVVWINRQNRFFPNWEVEKIVYIPLRNLLNPEYYACYRVRFDTGEGNAQAGTTQDFPCFLHQNQNEKEVLWGATYRIAMVFIELVFGFKPPEMKSLPVLRGTLGESYYNGGV
jgi:hypothetical protein